MKIKKTELVKIIKEEANRVLGESRYAQLVGDESQPHLKEMQEIQRKLGVLANDLIDKLGGSKEIQDAQSYVDDAARAIGGAMESIRDSLEQQGLSEQVGDPRMDAMKQCIQSLEGISFEDAGVNADALDNMKEEVMRKLRIMRFHLGKAADEQGEK